MSPGNGYVDLGFPTEYTTRNTVGEGGYSTKTMHFAVAWMSSKFENDNPYVDWTNGFWNSGTDRTYLAQRQQVRALAGQRDVPPAAAQLHVRPALHDRTSWRATSTSARRSWASPRARPRARRPPSCRPAPTPRPSTAGSTPRPSRWRSPRRRPRASTRACTATTTSARTTRRTWCSPARPVAPAHHRTRTSRTRTTRRTGASTRSTASTGQNRIGAGYDYLEMDRKDERYDYNNVRGQDLVRRVAHEHGRRRDRAREVLEPRPRRRTSSSATTAPTPTTRTTCSASRRRSTRRT